MLFELSFPNEEQAKAALEQGHPEAADQGPRHHPRGGDLRWPARPPNSSELDLGDLIEELRATKQEALNLRFRNATGQLDNTAEISTVRRQIARINTLIRQREIAAAEAGK